MRVLLAAAIPVLSHAASISRHDRSSDCFHPLDLDVGHPCTELFDALCGVWEEEQSDWAREVLSQQDSIVCQASESELSKKGKMLYLATKFAARVNLVRFGQRLLAKVWDNDPIYTGLNWLIDKITELKRIQSTGHEMTDDERKEAVITIVGHVESEMNKEKGALQSFASGTCQRMQVCGGSSCSEMSVCAKCGKCTQNLAADLELFSGRRSSIVEFEQGEFQVIEYPPSAKPDQQKAVTKLFLSAVLSLNFSAQGSSNGDTTLGALGYTDDDELESARTKYQHVLTAIGTVGRRLGFDPAILFIACHTYFTKASNSQTAWEQCGDLVNRFMPKSTYDDIRKALA